MLRHALTSLVLFSLACSPGPDTGTTDVASEPTTGAEVEPTSDGPAGGSSTGEVCLEWPCAGGCPPGAACTVVKGKDICVAPYVWTPLCLGCQPLLCGLTLCLDGADNVVCCPESCITDADCGRPGIWHCAINGECADEDGAPVCDP